MRRMRFILIRLNIYFLITAITFCVVLIIILLPLLIVHLLIIFLTISPLLPSHSRSVSPRPPVIICCCCCCRYSYGYCGG